VLEIEDLVEVQAEAGDGTVSWRCRPCEPRSVIAVN
jgi:hypothetical protein